MALKHAKVSSIDTKQNEAKDSSKVLLNAEIFGLGKKIKPLQPPGGRESGVFDAYRRPTENISLQKKVNFIKSQIFEYSPALNNKKDDILDLEGMKRKHLQPPGGSESGIFVEQSMKNIPIQRKVKNYLKSHIFEVSASIGDSAYRKCLHNKFKSSVFEPDPPMKPVKYKMDPHNPVTGKDDPKEKPKKCDVRNPITSEGIRDKDNFKLLRNMKSLSRPSGFVLEYNEMPTPF